MWDDKLIFSYDWLIKSFKRLYKDKNYAELQSDEFISSPSTTRHTVDDPDIKLLDPGTPWRIKLKLSNEQGYLSLFISYCQNKFDDDNEIYSRMARIGVELFLSDSTNQAILIKSYPPQGHYTRKSNENSYFRIQQFCDSKIVFDDNSIHDTHILIRANFYCPNFGLIHSPINTLPNFLTSFESEFNNEEFSDVIFLFDCHNRIHASSLILGLRSTFFQRIFNKHRKPQTVEVQNVRYEHFNILIYFIYTGKLPEESVLSWDASKNIIRLANMYEVKQLEEFVALEMEKMVNVDVWDELLQIALRIGNEKLKAFVLSYIRQNWDNLVKTQKMTELLSCDNHTIVNELLSCSRKTKQMNDTNEMVNKLCLETGRLDI
ncbi:POZ domain-containing protein [Gigaspora margarita]|uniref:POZ domain-containing protein n=1 Tax=Gigaspora margarita TaxID=4874 RepID=A0A8H4ADX5_GIGMA|nr:POZ domain-containing protein [Gigaspora margarita]